MWNSEQRRRMALEANLITKDFSGFSINDPKGKTYIEGWFQTNGGKGFKLKIEIPESYPYSKPTMYIMEPSTIYKKDGRTTINSLGSSYSFHTDPNGPGGVVTICHTKGWDSSRTLVQILKKGRLWCEAYEAHLQSGKDICDFLSV